MGVLLLWSLLLSCHVLQIRSNHAIKNYNGYQNLSVDLCCSKCTAAPALEGPASGRVAPAESKREWLSLVPWLPSTLCLLRTFPKKINRAAYIVLWERNTCSAMRFGGFLRSDHSKKLEFWKLDSSLSSIDFHFQCRFLISIYVELHWPLAGHWTVWAPLLGLKLFCPIWNLLWTMMTMSSARE